MNEKDASDTLTYRSSGVDIDAGNKLVDQIKPAIKSTSRPGVLGGIGGFGGLFELPWQDYKAPVLVSGTDGVGTKLRLAIDAGIHDSIGIDLVAMCVNDIIVTGAEPLFFLDYYATGALDVDVATQIIDGIANGCRQAGAALIGGETAEMPGLYDGSDYDLAGFTVGLVEKSKIIDGSDVNTGDLIIGLSSSGPHSNGYSLIRKILERAGAQQPELVTHPITDLQQSVTEALLSPTRIYVKPILEVIRHQHKLHALAHITGGGLTENIPRVLKPGQIANLNTSSWPQPDIFNWLQGVGNVEIEEMRRVFNCGIGMVVIVAADQADEILRAFENEGEKGWIIGTIETDTESSSNSTPPRVRYS